MNKCIYPRKQRPSRLTEYVQYVTLMVGYRMTVDDYQLGQWIYEAVWVSSIELGV